MREQFIAINSNNEVIGCFVMLDNQDTVAVKQQVLEYCKLALLVDAG
jgi:hypothetical protein